MCPDDLTRGSRAKIEVGAAAARRDFTYRLRYQTVHGPGRARRSVRRRR
jgi:hypothetical protein